VKRDIGTLREHAPSFRERLEKTKAEISPKHFEWYPYDSLANFEHLDALLKGENRLLLEGTGDEPVADICCADGDLAFYLESTGCRVHAFDFPVTNHNQMRGVQAVRDALKSQVEIFSIDLDNQFSLPANMYNVVFLLGALYHLKNPFYVLEALSKRARYCLLSTRIAAQTPDGRISMRDHPLAYLVGADELNRDHTNYWIFSGVGLQRLLHRANWVVLEYMTVGATDDSDPVHADERAFCLLRSRYAIANVELGAGWHSAETAGWRWTEQRFYASTQSADRTFKSLRMRIYVPPVFVEQWGAVTLRAVVNGTSIPPKTYTAAGEFEYIGVFPPSGTVSAQFEVERALPPDDSDPRERGLIVAELSFD
jgi:tRNA (mo5U34)-methyltransferase